MERFLAYVLGNLISFPEELSILKEQAPKKAIFRLRMRQSDIGKVVGKHGQTIAAIRTLINIAAARTGEKAFVEIIEGGEYSREESRESRE